MQRRKLCVVIPNVIADGGEELIEGSPTGQTYLETIFESQTSSKIRQVSYKRELGNGKDGPPF